MNIEDFDKSILPRVNYSLKLGVHLWGLWKMEIVNYAFDSNINNTKYFVCPHGRNQNIEISKHCVYFLP
jgi:hypothetical protein